MSDAMRDVWDRDGPVDRCVCHNRCFDELKALAHAEGLGFEALCERTRCSTGCGMCGPYVRLMLATGRTRFPALQALTIERALLSLDETPAP